MPHCDFPGLSVGGTPPMKNSRISVICNSNINTSRTAIVSRTVNCRSKRSLRFWKTSCYSMVFGSSEPLKVVGILELPDFIATTFLSSSSLTSSFWKALCETPLVLLGIDNKFFLIDPPELFFKIPGLLPKSSEREPRFDCR